jgi:hypothetical protein
LHASSCFDLDFTLSALADKGLAALKEEPRTLGFAVGVASRIRARLRRIAQGAFGLAGASFRSANLRGPSPAAD